MKLSNGFWIVCYHNEHPLQPLSMNQKNYFMSLSFFLFSLFSATVGANIQTTNPILAAPKLSLERVFQNPNLAGTVPAKIIFSRDGKKIF